MANRFQQIISTWADRINPDRVTQIGTQQQRIEALETAVEVAIKNYNDGPLVLTRDNIMVALGEAGYDQNILVDLLNSAQWESMGNEYSFSESQRARALKLSRKLWATNPMYQWAVSLWTVYGAGESITVTPNNRKAANVWTHFAKQQTLLKSDRIQDFSHNTLVDGETFLVYHASDSDGVTSMTSIDPSEIKEILTHPNDKMRPMFYKREFTVDKSRTETLYYPDWEAYFTGAIDAPVGYGNEQTVAQMLKVPDDKRSDKKWSKRKVNPAKAQFATEADALRPLTMLEEGFVPIAAEAVTAAPGTVSVIQHIPWNRKDRNSLRGWPLSTVSGPWLHSHRKFLSDRLAVTSGKASVIRRYQVAGGSQAVQAVQSTIASSLSRYNMVDSNPPGVAGGSLVMNKAVNDFEDMPMVTGANDAKRDNDIFAWIGILGLGSFPHYFGLGDAYRLATATAMEKPLDLTYSAYRRFLSAQFERMAQIVFLFNNLFGTTRITDPAVVVSTDRATTLDLINAADSIKSLFDGVLVPAMTNGVVPKSVVSSAAGEVLALMLDSLGASSMRDDVDAKVKDWISKMSDEIEPSQSQDQDLNDADDQDLDAEEIAPELKALAENVANGSVSPDKLVAFMLEIGGDT